MAEAAEWLSCAEASKRVKSSKRTVQRWRREGMPMQWAVDEGGQRYRVVELDVLLAWWRKTMQNSPVHFYRMRKKAAEMGLPAPVMPEGLLTSRISASTRGNETVEAGSDAGFPEKRIDPLADMNPLRGGAEYYALTEKLKDAIPGCAGIAEFTADKVDAETAAMMADICARCPLANRCAAFAAASRPTAGFWAGRTWREISASAAA